VGLAVALKPDVILMDIAMPKLDGVEAVRLIRTKQPAAVILMLTGSNSHSDIDRSRVSGAAGYVTKDLIASELIQAIVEASKQRVS
jgi:two-component system, NarL family, response regulator DegU